jgi:hypothetical protein
MNIRKTLAVQMFSRISQQILLQKLQSEVWISWKHQLKAPLAWFLSKR